MSYIVNASGLKSARLKQSMLGYRIGTDSSAHIGHPYLPRLKIVGFTGAFR